MKQHVTQGQLATEESMISMYNSVVENVASGSPVAAASGAAALIPRKVTRINTSPVEDISESGIDGSEQWEDRSESGMRDSSLQRKTLRGAPKK